MGTAIDDSNADIATLNRRNTQAEYTVRQVRVVLHVIVGPLNMQGEIIICCYLLHRLLRHQFPLVEALQLQIVDTIGKEFASCLMQMATIHFCNLFAYDFSCIMGNYLNTFMKASATVSL